MLGLGAAFLTGMAALAASQVGDSDYVPFFIGLSFLGGVEAWAARPPSIGVRRTVARGVAAVWLIAAAWVALLWFWYLAYTGGSRAEPGPTPTFLSIPVPVLYVLGLYGGLLLVAWSAFGRSGSRAVDLVSPPPRTP